MLLSIKDNKIYDICSELSFKRDNSTLNENYLDLKMDDWVIGDTWDSKLNISLKDSPLRDFTPIKPPLETKVRDLELRIKELEKK